MMAVFVYWFELLSSLTPFLRVSLYPDTVIYSVHVHSIQLLRI
jgi:hypothetical protein